MIAKITRGGDAPGLVRYLFSDGKANEHTEQRVVAADGALDVPIGRTLSAEERRELGRGLDAPHQLYGTEMARGYSWHLSLSTKGGVDRTLSDAEWAEIAAEVVARMGFTEGPGRAPCRWVAIRHGISDKGNDHMHLAVNLVREDGTAARLGRDYATVSKLCADMEARYGLYVVEGRKTGGMPGVKRAETERATRGGRSETERVELARRVRTAAVASTSEAEFVRRLRAQGVAARPRHAKGDRRAVVGYSVATEAPEGQQYLWYSGGKLAKDLSLPALRAGWSEGEQGRSEAVTEWGSRPHVGRGQEGRHRRGAGWAETAQTWGAGRQPAAAGGRETELYASATWDEAARQIAGVVADLAAVPAVDRAGWEAAASHAAGVVGALSARLEPAPGPLAAAADTLARSAQGRHSGPPPTATFPVTGALRSVAAVMAQTQITDESAVAWGVVVSELLRLAQAIHQAHLARGEAVAADRLAGEARSKLEEARASYGSAGRAAEALAEAIRAEVEAAASVAGHDNEGREGRHRKGEATPAMRPADYAALVARRAASERAAEVARDRGR